MNDKPDGGAAFPAIWSHGHTKQTYPGGMTLRDYLAGQMLTGVYAGGAHVRIANEVQQQSDKLEMSLTPAHVCHEAEKLIAAMCYATADAMIAERAK